MKPPAAVFTELLAHVRRDLFAGKPDKIWFAQRQLVKKAILYPARWLQERKVPLPADRYQAVIEGIIATMVANGNLDRVTYMSRYLLTCVQRHMDHHGEEYYQEGKAIRNRINITMSALERARKGDDQTIPTLAQADQLLQIGKRKPKLKPAPIADDQPGLF